MEEESLIVNYDKVMKSKNMLDSTRLLAMDIQENDYVSLTNYLTNLDDSDIRYLIGLLEDQDANEFGELLIISEMLANGEGLDPSTNAMEMKRRIEALISFLTLESLYRKGQIRIFRENMSFDEAYAKKTIAERL